MNELNSVLQDELANHIFNVFQKEQEQWETSKEQETNAEREGAAHL